MKDTKIINRSILKDKMYFGATPTSEYPAIGMAGVEKTISKKTGKKNKPSK